MIATKYAEAFNQHAPPKMVTFLSASYGRRCSLLAHVSFAFFNYQHTLEMQRIVSMIFEFVVAGNVTMN